MFARSLIVALSFAAPAAAYTKKDREDAIKWITEEKGFPHLAAFDKMTPKMLKTVMTNYLNLVSPDALEFLTPLDLEVIWTATSAANNCEICLSFHAGALLGAEKPADEVATMAAGGVLQCTNHEDSRHRRDACSMAWIHSTQVFAHACAQGVEDGAPRDCRVEVRARAQGHPLGAREAAPLFYGLLGRGARGSHLRRRPDGRLELAVRPFDRRRAAIETFLKGAGPFKDTVYADELKKAEL